MIDYSGTFKSELVDQQPDYGVPGWAIIGVLNDFFTQRGYEVREGNNCLIGLGHDIYFFAGRWCVRVSIGQMQDIAGLWNVFVLRDVNRTPFWVRWFCNSDESLSEVALLVDECLRNNESIHEMHWQSDEAYETRDFSKGNGAPIRRQHSRAS